jgi:hypothetical protein
MLFLKYLLGIQPSNLCKAGALIVAHGKMSAHRSRTTGCTRCDPTILRLLLLLLQPPAQIMAASLTNVLQPRLLSKVD